MARLGTFLAGALLMSVAACAGPGTGEQAPPGPVPVAEPRVPGWLLVPSTLPDGFAVPEVTSGPGLGEPTSEAYGVSTLYGDPDATDPLAAASLVVFWQAGTEAG